jgi:hypothetical protein
MMFLMKCHDCGNVLAVCAGSAKRASARRCPFCRGIHFELGKKAGEVLTMATKLKTTGVLGMSALAIWKLIELLISLIPALKDVFR